MKKTPRVMSASVIMFATTLAFGVSSTFADSLVVNGGFEDPALNQSFVTYFGGSSFPGWSVGGHSVDLHATETQAYAGLQSLDLSGFAAGSISQDISTVVGDRYVLSFWYSAHPYHPYAGDAMAQVYWGGNLVDTVSRPASPNITDMNWVLAEYSLVATSSLTELAFVSISPNGGIILDEVSLTPVVPEPATITSVGLGLAGLSLIRARRRTRN